MNPTIPNHRLVILESPYAGDIERNLLYARRALRDSILRGESPIASHLLYTQPGVLHDADHSERALGMSLGWAWIYASDAVVAYTDYGISKGMEAGLARARSIAKPILHRQIGLNLAVTNKTVQIGKSSWTKTNYHCLCCGNTCVWKDNEWEYDVGNKCLCVTCEKIWWDVDEPRSLESYLGEIEACAELKKQEQKSQINTTTNIALDKNPCP